ncbi:hypothetical protein EKO27_g10799 [Xylaria grammica]|uniref:Uncharacterized protein n=1 Tax=Xylaria grammica TaxID=363999 RepID=A0A439CQ77_9PEZI|nr:hypothetical protein EKO27_g10799 [Xylaria grammica]
MNLLRQPGVRALALLLALVTVYVTYGYFHFYRDPLSIFFSEQHGFDRFYSATREAEAAAFSRVTILLLARQYLHFSRRGKRSQSEKESKQPTIPREA